MGLFSREDPQVKAERLLRKEQEEMAAFTAAMLAADQRAAQWLAGLNETDVLRQLEFAENHGEWLAMLNANTRANTLATMLLVKEQRAARKPAAG